MATHRLGNIICCRLTTLLFTWFPRFLECPGIFIGKFSGSGKSWKITLIPESTGSVLAGSWKVLEFARQ